MGQYASVCDRMRLGVSGCVRMGQGGSGCVRMHQGVPECVTMRKDASGWVTKRQIASAVVQPCQRHGFESHNQKGYRPRNENVLKKIDYHTKKCNKNNYFVNFLLTLTYTQNEKHKLKMKKIVC